MPARVARRRELDDPVAVSAGTGVSVAGTEIDGALSVGRWTGAAIPYARAFAEVTTIRGGAETSPGGQVARVVAKYPAVVVHLFLMPAGAEADEDIIGAGSGRVGSQQQSGALHLPFGHELHVIGRDLSGGAPSHPA